MIPSEYALEQYRSTNEFFKMLLNTKFLSGWKKKNV